MKRCPKCEFTFDDHQEFCDFDDAELSIVPELVQALPGTASPSRFLRVSRSPATLAGLLLGGVTLSALMIGYYDAASSPDSVRALNLEHGEQVEVNTSSQVPAYVSIERRVTSANGASSMPSSEIKWLAEETESELSEARTHPPTSETPATLRANTRRTPRFNRQSLADDHRTTFRTSNKVAERGPDQNAKGMRRQKDSKVVAILKKTGSILTWPFKN